MGYGLMFLLYEPISFINSSLRASLAHQPHLSTLLRLLASVPTMPARFTTSFLGPFTSSLPLFTPMGLLLNSLEFLGPFTTSLPPIPLLGLLAFKLAHWVYQFIPWASSAHLLLIYLSFFPWGLLLCSSGFLVLFTPFLPLFISMGLLAINPAASARWACFLIFLLFCPSFPSHLLYCWASFAVRLFVKNEHQHWAPKAYGLLLQFICNTYVNFFPFFFFFCGFFKRWTPPCFLFCHEQAYLLEFYSLAVILKCNLRFINAMLFLMANPLPPFTSLLFVLAFSFLFLILFPTFSQYFLSCSLYHLTFPKFLYPSPLPFN